MTQNASQVPAREGGDRPVKTTAAPILSTPLAMRAGTEKALKAGPVALVDIGSAKTVWMIVQRDATLAQDGIRADERPSGALRVLSAGEAPSSGVSFGEIADVSEATQSGRGARDAAERIFLRKKGIPSPTQTLLPPDGTKGDPARAAIAVVSAGHPASIRLAGTAKIANGTASEADVAAAMKNCGPIRGEAARIVLYASASEWQIDGRGRIADPLGLTGGRLSVDLHALTLSESAIRSLDAVVDGTGSKLVSAVAAPLASGLGALSMQDRRDGAVVVDIGAGQVAIGVFFRGALIFGDALRLGAARATEDLMRAFDLTRDDAERIKILDGGVDDCGSDARVSAGIGGRLRFGGARPKKSEVARILRARMVETFEIVRDRLAQGGFYHLPSRRIMLAGGGAALTGIDALATEILGATVQIARPLPPPGSTPNFGAPAYAAIAGLTVALAQDDPALRMATRAAAKNKKPLPDGMAGRLAHWVRASW